MHYANGREAKNGDKVVHISPYDGKVTTGVLYDAVAGNDYCNGRLAAATPNDPCPNLKECLHADDVKAALGAVESVPDLTSVSEHVPATRAEVRCDEGEGTRD